MDNRFAVMDLGTNTFHLLIAEGKAGSVSEDVHIEDAVKLGEGGINKGRIQPEAFERGIKSLQKFADVIQRYQVKQVKAIATSALRSAANGEDFINLVKENAGIDIEVIDGSEEAVYIYKGVKAGGCLDSENSLIIDIGGGSVEFIICNAEKIHWKRSFEIGAARLMDLFHQKDPIPADCIQKLVQYLDDKLKDLFTAAGEYPVKNIIGSSGAHETYAELAELAKGAPFDLKKTKHYNFNKEELLATLEKLIGSSHSERAHTKGIVPIRVDMIVVAALVTRFIMKRLNVGDVMMSSNSLKEGVLADLMAETYSSASS